VRTAPDTHDGKKFFRVTHPFHPWQGRQFEFVDCRRCWEEWRVFYYTADMEMAYFPASWTDVEEPDPFVGLSQGRALGRVQELLRLAQLVGDLKTGVVNEIKPHM
jgi:hypothetical protein